MLEIDGQYVSEYQGRRLFEFDGEYVSRYQGGRVFERDGVVPVVLLALLATGRV